MALWENLVQSMGVPVGEVKRLVEVRWPPPVDGSDPELALTWTACRMIRDRSSVFDLAIPPEDLLMGGIYSPVQILLYQCAKSTKDGIEHDYPFCFSTLGYLIQLLDSYDDYIKEETGTGKTQEGDLKGEALKFPPLPAPDQDYRMLLQTIFQLRERTEERQSLSIEVRFPLEANGGNRVPVKKLAQVFGRGVATTDDRRLATVDNPGGNVSHVFSNHNGAPLSTLYELKQPFEHVPEKHLHIVLRRDGHITLATNLNSLLEFYDGGWHIVDLIGGQGAVSLCFDKSFEEFDKYLAEYVTRLSYHMATHWHGGIVAVVDKEIMSNDKQVFETPHSSVIELRNEIVALMKRKTKEICGSESLSLSECLREDVGFGRLLLSSAIQDGAILISPTAEFLDVGRIVSKDASSMEEGDPCGRLEGGARTYAACLLSKHGVTLKISQDGGISLFASKSIGSNGFKITNLRLH